MPLEPKFYCVFFDVDLPKNPTTAMKKRIDRNQFINLTDGIIEKQVNLDGSMYDVVSMAIFDVDDHGDKTFFVVCDVKN